MSIVKSHSGVIQEFWHVIDISRRKIRKTEWFGFCANSKSNAYAKMWQWHPSMAFCAISRNPPPIVLLKHFFKVEILKYYKKVLDIKGMKSFLLYRHMNKQNGEVYQTTPERNEPSVMVHQGRYFMYFCMLMSSHQEPNGLRILISNIFKTKSDDFARWSAKMWNRPVSIIFLLIRIIQRSDLAKVTSTDFLVNQLFI